MLAAAETHLPPGIELALSAPEPGPQVAADPDGLRQVLVNLVENAVKYSPDGGLVELEIDPSDGHVRFAVRDRGLGIPASEHERIFEKFFRLDPNLSRGVGGTGLGLYISREIVRRMGGRIRVESEPGPRLDLLVRPTACLERERRPVGRLFGLRTRDRGRLVPAGRPRRTWSVRRSPPKPPHDDQKIIESTRPSAPTTIRITPIVCSSRPEHRRVHGPGQDRPDGDQKDAHSKTHFRPPLLAGGVRRAPEQRRPRQIGYGRCCRIGTG